MSGNYARRLGPFAIIVGALISVFVPRPSHAGLWLETLFEWLHVPVFGVIALACLMLLPKSWPGWQRFGLAFSVTLALGVLTEALQIPMQRDASWEDIVADGTGAAGFLLAAFSLGQKRPLAVLSSVVALGLLTASAWPVIEVTRAIIHRNSQFPIIFGGDIASDAAFVSARNVRMETRWDASLGRMYTQLEAASGSGFGVEVRNLVADWSDYSVLELDVELEGQHDMPITLRVHDRLHRRGNQPHNDRFNRRFRLHPGRQILRIPLDDIEAAPRGRAMDMTDIEAIVFFSGKLSDIRVIRLYQIRLDQVSARE